MNGYKTYFIAFVLFCAGGAMSLGYLDKHTYDAIVAFLLPAGMATMRAAISNPR